MEFQDIQVIREMQGGTSEGPREAFANRMTAWLGTEEGVERLAGEEAEIQAEMPSK